MERTKYKMEWSPRYGVVMVEITCSDEFGYRTKEEARMAWDIYAAFHTNQITGIEQDYCYEALHHDSVKHARNTLNKYLAKNRKSA